MGKCDKVKILWPCDKYEWDRDDIFDFESLEVKNGWHPYVTSDMVGSCTSRQDRCLNGRCISGGSVCNGNNDCGDNSDERSCGNRKFELSVTNWYLHLGLGFPQNNSSSLNFGCSSGFIAFSETSQYPWEIQKAQTTHSTLACQHLGGLVF